MVCPPWLGYFLLSPLRKIVEHPEKMLGPLVREGMTVLEPGSGMGYFTLPLARMVGPTGRVVAVDIQPKMIAALTRRARKAGLAERIVARQSSPKGFGLGDLSGTVDVAVAIHVVHEIPGRLDFFSEMWAALKPAGKLLVVEPKGHVSRQAFAQTVEEATEAGFTQAPVTWKLGGRSAVFVKGA